MALNKLPHWQIINRINVLLWNMISTKTASHTQQIKRPIVLENLKQCVNMGQLSDAFG